MADPSGPAPLPPANPYVGPRAYDEADRDRFFGRAGEIRQLLSLVVARRVVLLYAPSGAGKTSLLQAGLLPRLRALRDVTVLPVARVGGEPPPGTDPAGVANLYTLSALQYLLGESTHGGGGGGSPGAEIPAAALTLGAGLGRVLASEPDGDRGRPHFLVLDQVEELYTCHPERYADRAAFLHQLRDALAEHPQVTLLLAMREDYIAQLDAHRGLLPDHLRNRFRLELLGVDAAREAAVEPARAAGVTFSASAAARLVDELRRVRVQGSNGRTVESLGPAVEPVQLQVVCRRLWERWARNGAPQGEIGESLLAEEGSVDQALAGYYRDQVEGAAAAAGIPERRVRDWIEGQLITAQGLRGQVLREPERTGGLDNRAVLALVAAHLVRAEERRGAVWFELAHDRLLAPVARDNGAWCEANLSTLERQAALWQHEGRPEGLVLTGAALAEAERWARGASGTAGAFQAASPHAAREDRDSREDLGEVERDFLAACRRRRDEEARARLQARKIRRWATAATLSFVVAGAGFGFALAAREHAVTETLAAQSQALLDERQDRALALALEVGERGDEIRSRQLLFEGLEARPRLRALLHGHTGEVLAVAWSPDGRTLASAGTEGSVRLWDGEGRPVGLPLVAHAGTVWSVAWSPDGRALASGGKDGALVVWDLSAAAPRSRLLLRGPEAIFALAFSPEGRSIVATLEDQTVRRWDAATGRALGPPLAGPEDWIKALAVSPDGRRIAAGSMDHRVWLWDVQGGEARRLEGHAEGVNALAFSPDGRTLASAGYDGTILLWDPATGQRTGGPLDSAGGSIEGLAWSPDGRQIAAGQVDGTLAVWNPASGRPIARPWTGHRTPLHGLAWSPDGRTLASAHGDAIALWNPEAGSRLGSPQPLPLYEVTATAARPDGRVVAVAGRDPGSQSLAIRLLAARRGTPLAPPFFGHADRVRTLAWNADGRTIEARCGDGSRFRWEAATGRPLPAELGAAGGAGAPQRVSVLASSPDGATLATATRDRRIFLWDAATGSPVAGPFLGHPDTIAALAFLDGGRTLLSLGADGTAFRWDVDPASWRRRARRLAGGADPAPAR